MQRWIDLNADLGEGAGDDQAILALVSSASLAAGAHAGGGDVLADAASAAAALGVSIGAHPSYRDREGFGRRSHLPRIASDLTARQELVADLLGQITDVAMAAARLGQPLRHVKAHGALYNDAVSDDVAAAVLVSAVQQARANLGYDLAILTQPGGQLASAATRAGLPVVREGFADRAYDHTGRLVPRGRPGALLPGVPEIAAQAVALVRGHVGALNGQVVDLTVDTICIHGDSPAALEAVAAVREALEAAGWTVAAPHARP